MHRRRSSSRAFSNTASTESAPCPAAQSPPVRQWHHLDGKQARASLPSLAAVRRRCAWLWAPWLRHSPRVWFSAGTATRNRHRSCACLGRDTSRSCAYVGSKLLLANGGTTHADLRSDCGGRRKGQPGGSSRAARTCALSNRCRSESARESLTLHHRRKRAENQEMPPLRAHVGALRACKHSAALASGAVSISCGRRLGSRAAGPRLADAAERNAVARRVPDVSACVQRFARDLRCARLECRAPAQRLPVARSDLGLCARIGVRVRARRV
jgi:hypothetical protein